MLLIVINLHDTTIKVKSDYSYTIINAPSSHPEADLLSQKLSKNHQTPQQEESPNITQETTSLEESETLPPITVGEFLPVPSAIPIPQNEKKLIPENKNVPKRDLLKHIASRKKFRSLKETKKIVKRLLNDFRFGVPEGSTVHNVNSNEAWFHRMRSRLGIKTTNIRRVDFVPNIEKENENRFIRHAIKLNVVPTIRAVTSLRTEVTSNVRDKPANLEDASSTPREGIRE